MIATNCTNCGAAFARVESNCEYCGTIYVKPAAADRKAASFKKCAEDPTYRNAVLRAAVMAAASTLLFRR